MPLMTWNLTLTVRGPFLTQSSTPGDYGVDARLARDKLERFYIPGTSLVGVLRKAWGELSELLGDDFKGHVNDWLGQESGSEDNPALAFLPQSKRLYFSDLTCPKRESSKTSYRIRIDEERGSVNEGAYLVIETPFAPGEEIDFRGQVYLLARENEEVTEITRYLQIGLHWITQLGAYGTVGFGELVEVKLEPPADKNQKEEKILPLPSCWKYDLVIRPQAPFCIAENHLAGNKLFKSRDVIPGNVIKGTLANFWKQLLGCPRETEINDKLDSNRCELGRYFDDIRVTHAFPGQGKVRPVQYPLSWVKVGDSFCDVAAYEMTDWIASHATAPAFAVDWKGKDFAKVKRHFGWPAVTRELRIRTAVNAETRRSSDEQLFAYEMVVPTGGMEWYAHLDLSAIPQSDRAKVVAQLRSLVAGGVVGLGKTKAYAELELLDLGSIRSHCPSRWQGPTWVVTLQTPALLCSPEGLTDSNSDRPAALLKAYSDTFASLSEESLVLQRFFAKQSLAGGEYLWKRFQYSQPYEPWLLTDAGSVFVLCPQVGKEEAAHEVMEKWFNTGLPIPEWAVKRYQLGEKSADYWEKCPFIPQHGFGEIAVNVND